MTEDSSSPRHLLPVREVHLHGVVTIVLELCLCLENLLPVLVLLCWRRPRDRTVAHKLVAALSATYILSAIVPTALGLASYFHGSWYGGASTCESFQVTSTWCRLSALAVVTYLSVDLYLTACGTGSPRNPSSSNTCNNSSSSPPRLSLSHERLQAGGGGIPHTSGSGFSSRGTESCDSPRPSSPQPRAGGNIHASGSSYGDKEYRVSVSNGKASSGYVSCGYVSGGKEHGGSISQSHGQGSNGSVSRLPVSQSDGHESNGSVPRHSVSQSHGPESNGSVSRHHVSPRTFSDKESWVGDGGGGGGGGGESGSVAGPCGRDVANLLLFGIFTLTLVVASLPVVGYGPEVMPHNGSCDSWLIATPASPWRRTYFVAYLAFGTLNVLVSFLGVGGAVLAVRSLRRRRRWVRGGSGRGCGSPGFIRWEGEPRYTEETISPPQQPPRCCNNNSSSSSNSSGGHHLRAEDAEEESEAESGSSCSRCYKMAGLVVANLAMWIPALVIIPVQKAGYPVSDATMMYVILSTSLPGLLNPPLLALLFRDYRLGYRYVLLRLCCGGCFGPGLDSSNMKNLKSRSSDSLHQLSSEGEAVTLNGSSLHIDDSDVSAAAATAASAATKAEKTCPVYAYPHHRSKDSDSSSARTLTKDSGGGSYVVVPLPNERTPLQGPATPAASSASRPIIASLYDEYGELSGGAPKTELLSPCGSEECLLNPELFRSQTESVV